MDQNVRSLTAGGSYLAVLYVHLWHYADLQTGTNILSCHVTGPLRFDVHVILNYHRRFTVAVHNTVYRFASKTFFNVKSGIRCARILFMLLDRSLILFAT